MIFTITSKQYFVSVKYFLYLNKYSEAFIEINNPELVELCSQNSILEAEREYFLGMISKNHESDKLSSPLMHFEKAYDLIKDENVSELTWKVMYEISQNYMLKGVILQKQNDLSFMQEN